MTEQTGTFTPPPSPGPQPPRPLQRSRSDRKVAGVAGGLAAYFGIDPIILRILLVVLSLFGGSGLLIYAAGWLLLPDEGEARSEVQKLLDRDGRPHSTGAVVVITLVIIGIVVGIGSIADGHWWLGGGPGIWPLLVIGGVAALIWYGRRQPGGGTPARYTAVPPAGPYTAAPQNPYVAGSQNPYVAAPQAPYATAPQPAYQPAVPYQPTADYSWTPPPVAVKQRRRKSVLGALTLSVAAIAAGIMIPLNASGAWHVHVVPFLAILLVIIGAGLIVGAFVGRSRGLIAWGILLSVVVAMAAAVPAIDAKGTGDVTWRPTSTAAIPTDGYEWAAGDARLDLTSLPPTGLTIHAQLGAGNLLVIVPANVRVVVDMHVGLGSLRLPDQNRRDGVGRRYQGTIEPLLIPGAAPAGILELRLDLGAGNLEVRRAQA